MDRSMIDIASGGALVDLTLAAAKTLISNMAVNLQQFWMQADQNPRRVNEVSTSFLENRVQELMSLMHHFITRSHQQVKSCGICSNIDQVFGTVVGEIEHQGSRQQRRASAVGLLLQLVFML